MDLHLFQVAAFSERKFAGNPAAVVPLEEWLDDALMQSIAAENNLSETAFFVPVAESEWHIRWFTPTIEVPLCGHATLASAAVIHRHMGHRNWPIRLQSASGCLTVDIDKDYYLLDLPANKPTPVAELPGLRQALGCDIQELHRGLDIYLAIVEAEETVAGLRPDFAALAAIVNHGVIVSAASERVDFVSRFFAPGIGIDEDPVTGAAHCVLTPYWADRLGRNQLRAQQISLRGGDLQCEYSGDRVLLGGRAVFYLQGVIDV